MRKQPKIPVLMYEEPKPGEPANPFPYVEVDKGEEMPVVLFVQEYKHTGEFEVDPMYGSAPIVDQIMHKFVDFEILKEKLDPETHDKVRVALGMLPLKEAQKSGQQTLDNANKKAESKKAELESNDDARAERAFVLGEDVRRKAEAFMQSHKQEEDEEN